MVNNISRYLKIWFKMAGVSMQLETEYRSSFILEILVEIGFFVVTLINIAVIYSNVPLVVGWTKWEAMILMGMYMVFSEIVLGLAFIFNLRTLPDKITKGDLDLILLKPIDSQFQVSLWRPYFASFPSLLSGIVVIFVGFAQSQIRFNIIQFLTFILIFLCGLLIAYSLGIIISSLVFWFINADSLPDLAEEVIFLSGRPSGVFPGFWRYLFLLIIPVIIMVSLPVEVLTGKQSVLWLPFAVIMAAIFLFLSRRFWLFALRHYSSASS